ncbi:MAG: hypothetical protein WC503_01215 [Candidatus Shapirobacteria bacterium]
MKLWRLIKSGKVQKDEHVCLLIRAKSEKSARIVARTFADEYDEPNLADSWLDPKQVICQKIKMEGLEEVLIEQI